MLHILKRNHISLSLQNMDEKAKQERAVIHLEMDGKHYYYGNIKAMCDCWGDALGVSYNYLRNYGLKSDKPYVGKKCTVRKGVIVTSPHKA